MSDDINNQRKFKRFGTELGIHFYVTYDIHTKVKYQIIDESKQSEQNDKHSALSKNISAEGLCFTSDRKLAKGDILFMEVYLPGADSPIVMDGEVRWSKPEDKTSEGSSHYDTGVKIQTVGGTRVEESIYFDEKNRVVWSAVLESIFGSFKKISLDHRR